MGLCACAQAQSTHTYMTTQPLARAVLLASVASSTWSRISNRIQFGECWWLLLQTRYAREHYDSDANAGWLVEYGLCFFVCVGVCVRVCVYDVT